MKAAPLCVGGWMAGSLLLALGQNGSSGPDIDLTCLSQNETISRHAGYPITWTAQDIPPSSMLSLRIQWTSQNSAENSRLIGMVLDSAAQQAIASRSQSAGGSPTIESGEYLWDVDKFCSQNRQGNRSFCDTGLHFRLQAILRSMSDPCGDSMHCAKPRSLFKVYESEGTFAFRD